MKRICMRALMVAGVCLGLVGVAFSQQGGGDDGAIRAVLEAQVAAWNHADVRGFMQGYENSPETTFIGTAVRKGFEPILKKYEEGYRTPEQMGKLTFGDLDVRLLPSACGKPEYAVVTGHFHLERTAKGEATKDDGIFSLVWHKGEHGWKILMDHTSWPLTPDP